MTESAADGFTRTRKINTDPQSGTPPTGLLLHREDDAAFTAPGRRSGYLARRDARWLQSLATHVDTTAETPQERLLAVFDRLEDWFTQPDFHGCAFINSFGELGGTSPQVAALARHHKDSFHTYVRELTTAAGAAAHTGTQIALLAEGAMTTAAISGTPEPARQAKHAARLLLTPHTRHAAPGPAPAQVGRRGDDGAVLFLVVRRHRAPVGDAQQLGQHLVEGGRVDQCVTDPCTARA